MDPLLAARIMFYVFVIHEFEHALLRLKNDDCIWGPVHTSIGQEAIAAASVTALRKTDKFISRKSLAFCTPRFMESYNRRSS
jgi:TPP-dependent pyruvate/acetoin dehydrogenase alpha subunit